LHLDQYIFVF